MIDDVISRGLQGVLTGQKNAARHAEQVSRAFEPGREAESDIVEGLVGLSQDKHQIEASAKVIKTGDELNNAILDILA
ncbi:MAG: hypothetical protein D6719_09165 [Candidatus Dadabacteria bacterium]|nr:MAG: hypothetical protein D6719_09165 [Candidatus Dadabacteria bacterium]